MRLTVDSNQLALAKVVDEVFDQCVMAGLIGSQISFAMEEALNNLMAIGSGGPALVKVNGQRLSVSPMAALVLLQGGRLFNKWADADGIDYYSDFSKALSFSIHLLEQYRDLVLESDDRSGRVSISVNGMKVGMCWHGSVLVMLSALGFPMDQFNEWASQRVWELAAV